jgi:hypothetical protein
MTGRPRSFDDIRKLKNSYLLKRLFQSVLKLKIRVQSLMRHTFPIPCLLELTSTRFIQISRPKKFCTLDFSSMQTRYISYILRYSTEFVTLHREHYFVFFSWDAATSTPRRFPGLPSISTIGDQSDCPSLSNQQWIRVFSYLW